MKCRYCGAEIAENASFCTECGAAVQAEAPTPAPAPTPTPTPTPTPAPAPAPAVNDEGGFLWGLLGCCIPLAGLILFLVWKDTKPKSAKAAGIGALVCVILYVLYYLFFFVLGIGIGLADIAGAY